MGVKTRSNGYSCVVCGYSSLTSVELVRETFRPTLTLERTLEKLREGMCEPVFNVKDLFKVMTGEEGGLFCCTCLGAIHGGMPAVAQLIKLEGRLKIFGAMIGNLSMNSEFFGLGDELQDGNLIGEDVEGCDQSDVISEILYPVTVPDSQRSSERADNADCEEESLQNLRRSARNPVKVKELTKRVIKSTTSTIKTIKSKTSSNRRSALPSGTTKVAGIQNCPSCDFSIDVRTPAEVNSTEPLSYSVRDALRKKSNHRLTMHFRSHMPEEAELNFEKSSNGVKMFICLECPYRTREFLKLVRHYMAVHITDIRQGRTGPSRLSCSENSCEYFVDVPLGPEGRRSKYSQRIMREALATHVLRDHDIPLSSSHKSNLKKNKDPKSLFIQTEDNRKEYRCTRCEHTERIPEKPSASDYRTCRSAFLCHFYYSHLHNPT